MPEDSLITVTDATFQDVVINSTLPIAVDFWAEWCPPCRPMAKTLSELATEFPGQIVFAKINADENPDATRRYRIMSMPTLLLFKQGQVVKSIVGARPKSYLRDALTTSDQPYANT